MSRGSTREYILRKQEDYIGELNRHRKSKVLDEVCAVTGLERKYASRLLSGAREYRERKSRGKAHGKGAEKLLEQAWKGAGCPNEKYLKVVIGKVLEDLGQLQNVRGNRIYRIHRIGRKHYEIVPKTVSNRNWAIFLSMFLFSPSQF